MVWIGLELGICLTIGVKGYDNGGIMQENRELVVQEEISVKTLASMDQTIHNFKNGKTSDSVDLSDF